MSVSRRSVVSGSAALLAFGGLSRALAQEVESPLPTPSQIRSDRYASEIVGYGPLQEDPAGLFDLPPGFSYTVVSRAGDEMDDGLLVPHSADGMGCLPLGAGRVALVCNHEIKLRDAEWSAFGSRRERLERFPASALYDRYLDGGPLGGGTTTIVYDTRARRTVRRHLSLAGTVNNCAGGVTPEGSWLSCEETTVRAGDRTTKDHGWVFEVPAAATGPVEPRPVRGLGRFKHEATATDPRTGVVYLTEDEGDDGQGLCYRFLPNDRRNLHAGGRLQALGFRGAPDADPRNWREVIWRRGDTRETVWIDLDGTDNPHDDLRFRGRAAGAAWFARGEGVFFGRGELFFACTSGGALRRGQIMRYRPSPWEGQARERERPGRLQLFIETDDRALLDMPDNIAVSPWGHLVACEDKAGAQGVNYLRGITPHGRVYTLGRNPQPLVSNVGANSELAGACFSPDGSTLFVNVYAPGMTLAITGPWNRFSGRRA